ncbi:SGNH/GDSL hydrolase family protein [Pararhizobium sp. LjRoot235]|uniref:SGNH/GDSL hydrolase family protein n=1 Tax=Pararhizobium sp. LjRoot235 TaxID=3342291 RepID=UPI003F4F72B3
MSTKTAFRRGVNWLLNGLIVIAVGATAFVMEPPRQAGAQERRSIIDMLFGFGRRRPPPVYEDVPIYEPRQRQPQQRQKPRKIKQKTKPAPVEPAPVVVEKLENAKKVLVVGDFMAGSLGDGLKVAFETTPGVVIETRANGSSGLVREDYFNWPENLPVYVAEVSPSIIIVSLGANERQQMSIDGEKEKFRADRWLAEYTRRTGAFAALARSENIPLLWVGMPPFQSTAMTADMVTLNGIFRAETEKVGGSFIDIWDGFVDESGKFVMTGSDINGQQVRLRGSDGINLTKAGKRKLAFYVEKDIRKLLGDAAVSTQDVPGADGLKDLVVAAPTANEDILQTQPISLDDPDLDGGATLLGGTAPLTSGKSPRDRLVEKGEIADAPVGRVDDFRLAKPETVISNPVMRN